MEFIPKFSGEHVTFDGTIVTLAPAGGGSRFAFDALQTKQEKGTLNTVLLYPFNRVREGQPSQRAQRAGHNIGYSIFKQRQFEKQMERATNPWPIGPKY